MQTLYLTSLVILLRRGLIWHFVVAFFRSNMSASKLWSDEDFVWLFKSPSLFLSVLNSSFLFTLTLLSQWWKDQCLYWLCIEAYFLIVIEILFVRFWKTCVNQYTYNEVYNEARKYITSSFPYHGNPHFSWEYWNRNCQSYFIFCDVNIEFFMSTLKDSYEESEYLFWLA